MILFIKTMLRCWVIMAFQLNLATFLIFLCWWFENSLFKKKEIKIKNQSTGKSHDPVKFLPDPVNNREHKHKSRSGTSTGVKNNYAETSNTLIHNGLKKRRILKERYGHWRIVILLIPNRSGITLTGLLISWCLLPS